MYIKHSKFKNTGILFELLVRKITADTLAGIESPSVNILKKYFVNTELGKEYKLYETIFKPKNITEGKANAILGTILEASKKLNRKSLKREKYNIVKELREHYNVEDLFKTNISHYKSLAALYTLFEIYNSLKPIGEDNLQVPYFEIPESMKLDISEKGVPIAKVKQNKEMTASSMA